MDLKLQIFIAVHTNKAH